MYRNIKKQVKKTCISILCVLLTVTLMIVPGSLLTYSEASSGVSDDAGVDTIAFTSDIHNNGGNNKSADRLGEWIEQYAVAEKDRFELLATCGDNGSGAVGGDNYWNSVKNVMDVVSDESNYIKNGGIFLAGNHEWWRANGDLENTKDTNDTAKKIIRTVETTATYSDDDYEIFCFGPTVNSQTHGGYGFLDDDIASMETYLSNSPTDRPIFILSHYPLHDYTDNDGGKSIISNEEKVISTINKYCEGRDIYFLWGHNHSRRDPKYNKIIKDEIVSDNDSSIRHDISFTYLSAGCMADSEYNVASASTLNKGLVARIDTQSHKVELQYYSVPNEVRPAEGEYLIKKGNSLLTAQRGPGYYGDNKELGYRGLLAVPFRTGMPITSDMIWTVEHNGLSGFYLKNGTSYLNGYYLKDNTIDKTGDLTLGDKDDVWVTRDGSSSCLLSVNTGKYIQLGDSSQGDTTTFSMRSSNADKFVFIDPPVYPEVSDDAGVDTIAFTSDIHNDINNNISADRLAKWIEKNAVIEDDKFELLVTCGDNGSQSIGGDTFWNSIKNVMDVVDYESEYIKSGGIFLAGNHEWSKANGNLATAKDTNETAKKIIGTVETSAAYSDDDYEIFCFGPTINPETQGGRLGFLDQDIAKLDAYLSSAPTDKPIFILSHYPLHDYVSTTGEKSIMDNKDNVISTINKYSEGRDIYFLWGHNHNKCDPKYNKIIRNEIINDNDPSVRYNISFTYLSAGCMADSEYYTGSKSILSKGLVARIDTQSHNVEFRYYGMPDEVRPEEGQYLIITGNSLLTAQRGPGYFGDKKELGYRGLLAVPYESGMNVTPDMVWTVEHNDISGFYIKNGSSYLNGYYLKDNTIDKTGDLTLGEKNDVWRLLDGNLSSSLLSVNAGKYIQLGDSTQGDTTTFSMRSSDANKFDFIEYHDHQWQETGRTKATFTGNGSVSYACTYKDCEATKTETVAKAVASLSKSAYTYNGKAQTPSVTVKSGNTTLKNGIDYSVTWSGGRKSVGKYSAKITLKGKYSGAKTLSYNINPKKATIKKPYRSKKYVKVKWYAQRSKMATSRITGYQVQIARNKSFTSGKKTYTVKGYSKTSKKISKLKRKTQYYVRVRTYKTVSGVKYYSGWSSIKSAKTR